MAFRNAQRWLVRVPTLVGVLLATPIATAQSPLQIPTEIVTKTDRLSAQEEGVIRQFVAAHAPNLESDDPRAVSDARKKLQAPLMGMDPSTVPAPPFRFAYTTELVSHLERLVASDNPSHQVIALHLAGQIATERSTQLPLQHLDDEDVSVRYAAARAIGLTFQALDRSAPAVRNVPAMIRELGGRLIAEDDPMVLDRLIRTLRVAANFQGTALADNRVLAIDQISQAVGQRLQKLDPQHNNVQRLQMLLRALEAVRESFLQGAFVGPANAARDRSVTTAAGLGGDAMVYVAKRVKLGIDKADERALLIKIAQNGETIIFFAASAHTRGVAIDPPNVAALLQSGRDREYLEKLSERYVGPGGVLVSAPFSFDAARFAY